MNIVGRIILFVAFIILIVFTGYNWNMLAEGAQAALVCVDVLIGFVLIIELTE